MLHRHQLDMIDFVARNILKADQPFGGLQVILCGDFFQLPPVSSSPNEIQFAFEADAWKNGNFHVCYLQEQHRQGGDPLLAVLNDIRRGTTGEHTKIPFFHAAEDQVSTLFIGSPYTIYRKMILKNFGTKNVDKLNVQIDTTWVKAGRKCKIVEQDIEIITEVIFKESFVTPEEIRSLEFSSAFFETAAQSMAIKLIFMKSL